MNRFAFGPALAILASALIAPPAFAQATPAAPAQNKPAARAKWIPPVKGTATIEVIRGTPKREGNDVVTVLQIKNTSSGSIALLRVDELWYDKSRKNIVSGTTERYRKPFNPGEIIEITLKSPIKPNIDVSQITFSHANGKIDAKAVKKFSQ